MSSERLYATGRRKTSSARIYLSQGEGSIKVNNKELSDYFGREVAQMLVKQPLELCNLIDKVDIVAKVKGGGSFVKQELSGMVFLGLFYFLMKS